ncbi:hypothetical protein LIER_29214 [Lithospermum erythrorhizon]|uniref:Uncharacterized protein n=1 Tax=Lithospermum erythrorhizon TaxID=34254 RepID=A0AAV3RK82_LITER
MGNCSIKGQTDVTTCKNFIRIMRDSGEILELKGPKIVADILTTFPGYNIFIQGQISNPLLNNDKLFEGHFYYLLPSIKKNHSRAEKIKKRELAGTAIDGLFTRLSNGSGLEVLASPRNGVWRVKLAIHSKTLEEILSEEVNTEALIEQMRMAANSNTVTPRRTKSSWGVNWKPTAANVY